MRNVSSAFRQMLFQNKRKYNNTLLITLADGTEFTVTNANIMDGGIDIDDAVGDDGDFNALGSTVIRGCEVTLYNNNINYSDYDFINAKVIVKTNLVGADSSDELQLGVFTVDEPTYSDYSVSLSLLDNMRQFDRTYNSYSIYTNQTTLFDIVSDACTKCGVLYDSSMNQFPNYDFVVPNAPEEDCTYREVIGWCATLAGCFAKITDEGKLKFDWFDIDAFNTDDLETTDGGKFDSASPYATGDSVNGGTFNPWNDPSSLDAGTFAVRNNIYYIGGLNTQNIGTDDVVITGIQVTYDVETNNSNSTETQLEGTDDYVISIEGNPFITANNYEDVLTFLNPVLIGLQFRPCNITQPNDPTVEAGDVAYIWDTKGVQHRTLITRATFNPTSLQTIICGAKTPAHNSSNRLSAITKAIVKSRRQLNAEKSIRQQLESSFNTYVANAKGLYLSEIPDGGSVIIYGHDKPNLTDSKMVLKVSNGAISMTNDYRGTDAATSAANAWYGFQFDGTWLANIISTVSLFFNYAHGGTLRLGGGGNGRGQLAVYDDNDDLIGSWTNNGISLSKGAIHGPNITVGGDNNVNGTIAVKDASNTTIGTWSVTGIHVYKGGISGTTISAGGNNNEDGTITVKNASGSVIGRWNKDGLTVTSGSISGNAIYGGSITLGGNNNENGRLYVNDANGNRIGAWGQGGIQIYSGTIQGPNIIAGGSGNTNGTITVKNASGTTIGTWDKDGLSVTSGSISGSLIKTGRITDANENVILNLNTGEFTMKQGSININEVFKVYTNGSMICTSANVTGIITSIKDLGTEKLKVIIDEANISGYQDSTLFGKLDLCAQYTDELPHASLESPRYLHLEAGTKVSFETGGIGGAGYERAYADNSGFHVSNGANISKMAVAVDFDGSGQATSWFLMKVVDGIVMEYY